MPDETAKEIEKLVFARFKSACIKGFRARSAGGLSVTPSMDLNTLEAVISTPA